MRPDGAKTTRKHDGTSSLLCSSWLRQHASWFSLHTCHRHLRDLAACVLILKCSCFTRRFCPSVSVEPAASPRSACPRTTRVVSTARTGAEPTVHGDGVRVDRENATYLFSEPISCGSPRIGIHWPCKMHSSNWRVFSFRITWANTDKYSLSLPLTPSWNALWCSLSVHHIACTYRCFSINVNK